MRRAVSLVALSAALLLAYGAPPAAAQTKLMNGIGLLDYSSPPKWKVGDWVRYKFTGSSEKGKRDDFTTTLLIAGEEEFWGERCFWLETWTDARGQAPATLTALVSYAVFEDSLATAKAQYYVRKTIEGITEDGQPDEQLYLRAPSSLKTRSSPNDDVFRTVDSLGRDTVTVTKGHFACRKVGTTYYVKASATKGDSSFVDEITEKRTTYLNDEVPITLMARQDIDMSTTRKTWFIGQSASAVAKTLDHGKGTADLIGWGHGEVARLHPKDRQKSFAEQGVSAPKAPATRARTASTRKKG